MNDATGAAIFLLALNLVGFFGGFAFIRANLRSHRKSSMTGLFWFALAFGLPGLMVASTLVVGSNRGESQWGVAFALLRAAATFNSLIAPS